MPRRRRCRSSGTSPRADLLERLLERVDLAVQLAQTFAGWCAAELNVDDALDAFGHASRAGLWVCQFGVTSMLADVSIMSD